MDSKKTALGLLVAALTFAGAAAANETIYKWTDENGNVHYGDRPSDGTEQSQTEGSQRDYKEYLKSQRRPSGGMTAMAAAFAKLKEQS